VRCIMFFFSWLDGVCICSVLFLLGSMITYVCAHPLMDNEVAGRVDGLVGWWAGRVDRVTCMLR
jgi:hypothetical protein